MVMVLHACAASNAIIAQCYWNYMYKSDSCIYAQREVERSYTYNTYNSTKVSTQQFCTVLVGYNILCLK